MNNLKHKELTNESDHYIKIVSWSESDNCYIGLCPEVTSAECRGDNERDVFEALCNVVEETVALHRLLGKPLPGTTNLSPRNQITHITSTDTEQAQFQLQKSLSVKQTDAPDVANPENPCPGTPYRYRSTLMSNQNRFLRDCSVRVRIS